MPADYDLEARLLEYSARIIRLVEGLPNTRAGNHLAGQLLRSGTSPLPNHGEAQAAVYGVPALAGQTQFHHGSPSVSSSLQGTARRRLKPGLHTLPPARVCYSALCSLVPLWNAEGCAFPTSPSAIPKGLCPPAQGCEQRATLGKGSPQRSTPTGLWPPSRHALPQPRWGWRLLAQLTQGSSLLATLGFETEPLWDSPARPTFTRATTWATRTRGGPGGGAPKSSFGTRPRGLSCISQTDYRSWGDTWESHGRVAGHTWETPGGRFWAAPASARPRNISQAYVRWTEGGFPALEVPAGG